MAQQIQLRRGTSTEWTTANPILADGEIGIETDTGLYKVGNGINLWSARPYSTLRSIDTATVVNMPDQATPSAPATGTINIYAKLLSGRMMLRQQGSSGLATPFQPSFFQNNIMMINTNTTTTITSIGQAITSVGTISHPTPTALYGFMANFVTAGTAGATAGTGTSLLPFVRNTNVADASGFFFNARLAFPDSNYNETGASTGSRIYVGLTSRTMAQSVATDNESGTRVGFHRLHVNGSTTDTNWFLSSRDSAEDRIDTGLAFTPECVYDFYLFCPPDGASISWRIDNVTLGTSQEGSTTTQMPTIGTYMRPGFQIQTVNAIARNVRMQRVYIESDR
jgi:hypothetical protein